MLAKPVAFCFVPSEPVVFRNYSFSLILLNPSSVVFRRRPPSCTALRSGGTFSAWPAYLLHPHHQGMGKSCTAGRSAHIPVRRSSDSTAVLWSFPLLQNSRHKQVPVPIRPSPFLTGQVSSARHDLKKHPQSITLCGCLVDIWILFFSFSDVCQTSGYCGSLFSASSPASSAMRTRSLPSL